MTWSPWHPRDWPITKFELHRCVFDCVCAGQAHLLVKCLRDCDSVLDEEMLLAASIPVCHLQSARVGVHLLHLRSPVSGSAVSEVYVTKTPSAFAVYVADGSAPPEYTVLIVCL